MEQNTKANWTNVYFGFATEGIPDNAIYSQSSSSLYYVSSLNSGNPVTITLPAAPPGIMKGKDIAGRIWAKYNSSNQSVQYVQIASINIKAT